MGAKAEQLAHILTDPADRRDLVTAAWLHDIGYGLVSPPQACMDSTVLAGFGPTGSANASQDW